MEELHKKIIDSIIEERLDTSFNIGNLQNASGKHLLGNMNFSYDKNNLISEPEQSIKKYILPFPKRTERIYNPDLESAWETMQNNEETENGVCIIQDIEYIIDNYKNFLSFDDMLTIQTMLVSRSVWDNNLDNASLLLENIKHYENSFNHEQRQKFLYILGIVYFYKAAGQNNFFYERSLACFDEILVIDLDSHTYLDILSKKIYALYKLHDYNNCLPIVEEFLSLSENYTQTDETIITCKIDALQIQGVIYESKKEYKKAIKSFREYLKYQPNDEDMKRRIRILSEKLPE